MAKNGDAKKALQSSSTTDIRTLIEKSAAELGKALPSHMRPERIVRIALTTLRQTPKLYNCDPMSFLGALFQSAQLGLEPNIEGQAYIIPYGKQAQFQIGFKGYVELFYRHQAALSLDMQEVCENDDFEYAYGTESFLKHVPALGPRGAVKAYYAVAKMQDGASVFKVMSRDDCLAHGKKHSKTYSNGPWQTDTDAMCKKTVLIQLMKLVPKSIEIQRAIAMDETTKSTVAADMMAIPDETDWSDTEDAEHAPVEPKTAPVSEGQDDGKTPAASAEPPTGAETNGKDGLFGPVERGKCKKCGDEALINADLCGQCTVDEKVLKDKADAKKGRRGNKE